MAGISVPQSCGKNQLDGGVGGGQLLEGALIGSVWLEGGRVEGGERDFPFWWQL